MNDRTEITEDQPPGDPEGQLGALFDDPDFAAINRRMSPFNLFEAVGAIRAELRHSNFLAYLLSPSRPHGLRARPLATVLRAILARLPLPQRPIMTLELIAGELEDAIIYRERDNIDILIDLPTLKFVVAIENKIGAKAAEGQLERYSAHLKSAFPEYRRLLVFLTPDGIEPNHDLYVSYSYAELAEVLDSLAREELELVPAETRLIIHHYVDMVRRHIVQDERLRQLALTLYERHKEAFEFIFECRPEPHSLLTVLRQSALDVQGLVEDSSGSSQFRFAPEVWDKQLKSIKGDPTKWSKTGRGLLFEVKTYSNTPGRVNISLILGPGDSAVRASVYQAAYAQPDTFSGLVRPMGTQWATIFSRDLLTPARAKDLTVEAQAASVALGWSEFQTQNLMPVVNAVLAIDEQLTASEEVS